MEQYLWILIFLAYMNINSRLTFMQNVKMLHLLSVFDDLINSYAKFVKT